MAKLTLSVHGGRTDLVVAASKSEPPIADFFASNYCALTANVLGNSDYEEHVL